LWHRGVEVERERRVTKVNERVPSVSRPLFAGLSAPTRGQWVGGFLVPGLTLLLPLAVAHPGRLLHPSPWVCFLAAVVIYVTQPPLRLSEAFRAEADGKSVVGIILAGLAVSIAPVMDFGFRAALRPAALSGWVLHGTLLVAVGTGLRVWAISLLGRYFTAVVAVQAAQPVVDSGPYRLVRHPSYSGALLAALGAATVCESAVGLVVSVGFLFPVYLYRIRREEAHLRAQLGEPYARYSRRTTRLIPYVL
jgi:protein-S-isoprenylcysteine O-methyltransferase Ste14